MSWEGPAERARERSARASELRPGARWESRTRSPQEPLPSVGEPPVSWLQLLPWLQSLPWVRTAQRQVGWPEHWQREPPAARPLAGRSPPEPLPCAPTPLGAPPWPWRQRRQLGRPAYPAARRRSAPRERKALLHGERRPRAAPRRHCRVHFQRGQQAHEPHPQKAQRSASPRSRPTPSRPPRSWGRWCDRNGRRFARGVHSWPAHPRILVHLAASWAFLWRSRAACTADRAA